MNNLSPLQKKRLAYQPVIPDLLRDLKSVCFKTVKSSRHPPENLRKLFPKTFDSPSYSLTVGEGKRGSVKVGVVFSGGLAAGGHNVIAGICDAGAHVIGFLGGPSGIVDNKWKEIKEIGPYRNQGGFDLLGSGRTKIETAEQLAASMKTMLEHQLDGLVVIGGDDSNTNAAVLAEYFLAHGCQTRVVGVPKTIDGDLRSADIEISFGFDSACKTYAELIGNIARDGLSARKYYHFIKLMGRSASHIALECAMATHPNMTLIGEERKGLEQMVGEIADLVCRRSEAGKGYGVILIPEGLIEFVPELTKNLNLEKDPHGNVELSKIETEKFLIDLVLQELKKRQFKGKFNALGHSFGYEGRACLPSNFDANYCTALGLLAVVCVREGLTGVICAVQNLKKHPNEWQLKAVPIVQLMRMETRLGKEKPVIEKALVDMKGKSFVYFSQFRKSWEIEDQYRYPGPIQFFGDAELTDGAPLSLMD
ncbi:MAG TPA: 6-phosphofructokinase [Chlamydiales bacterium]|nr:6-phosphofructokinase [Chlamydiales bacterium]